MSRNSYAMHLWSFVYGRLLFMYSWRVSDQSNNSNSDKIAMDALEFLNKDSPKRFGWGAMKTRNDHYIGYREVKIHQNWSDFGEFLLEIVLVGEDLLEIFILENAYWRFLYRILVIGEFWLEIFLLENFVGDLFL